MPLRFLEKFESRLSAYDMLAATVVVMVGSHVFSYFGMNDLWLRVPDRILLPIFLVPIGYNAGRQFDWMLLFWSAALVAEKQILMSPYFNVPLFPLPILVSIGLARLVLEPLMRFAIRSKLHFWGVFAVIAYLAPVSNNVIEGGFLILLLAMAGWLVRNKAEVPEKVLDIRHYFFVLFIYHNCFAHYLFFNGPLPQLAVVLFGNAYIFYLLYRFRDHVMVSVRRRPNDMIEKICSFIGHKSLEIYALHILVLQALLYVAIK